jgi:iron complex transport system substrate-binding protein
MSRVFIVALVVLVSTVAAAEPPRRIVSFAPSITEMLFALGVGDRVVGVTRYCDYPGSVEGITRVGGYMDPSYETLVALQPDLTIVVTSHDDARRELDQLGLAVLTVPHDTVADIHKAIRRIGEAVGREDEAARMVMALEDRVTAVREAVADRPRPRTLVCIGRDTDTGQLAGMYMAGRHDFYDEMIEMAGGVNAYRDETVKYPQLSAEGIIQLNPDVIVDLVSELKPDGPAAKAIAAQWDVLHPVEAVRQDRVYVVAGQYALRPGPRYVRFLEELARLLHPEAFARDGAPDDANDGGTPAEQSARPEAQDAMRENP